MPLPKFIDAHPAFNAGGYYATNESPKAHLQLLGDRRYQHGLSICSGGEVPLFVLGPRCDNLIAVDHGYVALTATFLKAVVLDKMGLKGLKGLLLEGTVKAAEDVFKDAAAEIPEVCRASLVPANGYPMFNMSLLTSRGGDAGRWIKEVPDDLEAVLPQVLGRLTLVHGDLQDVAAEGPFDILYGSNTHEHSGRGGSWSKVAAGASPRLGLKSYTELVKPGGHLLATGTFTYAPNALRDHTSNWKQLVTTHAGNWHHHLLERLPPVAEVAA